MQPLLFPKSLGRLNHALECRTGLRNYVLLSLVSLQTLQQILCDPGQGTINLGIGSEEFNFKSSRAKGGVNLKSS